MCNIIPNNSKILPLLHIYYGSSLWTKKIIILSIQITHAFYLYWEWEVKRARRDYSCQAGVKEKCFTAFLTQSYGPLNNRKAAQNWHLKYFSQPSQKNYWARDYSTTARMQASANHNRFKTQWLKLICNIRLRLEILTVQPHGALPSVSTTACHSFMSGMLDLCMCWSCLCHY